LNLQAEVAKHGWLTKQGAIVKNWKKRYFIVQNGRMSYFDGPNGKEPGTILLAGCRYVFLVKKFCNKIMVEFHIMMACHILQIDT